MIRLAALAFLVTASAASAGSLFFGAPQSPGDSPVTLAASKRPIDKSCLMICKRWGDDDCLEWKMVCKGDSDYPKPVTAVLAH